jgi:hypothetical protein
LQHAQTQRRISDGPALPAGLEHIVEADFSFPLPRHDDWRRNHFTRSFW